MANRLWRVTCYDGGRKLEWVLTGGPNITEAAFNAWQRLRQLRPDAFPVDVPIAIIERVRIDDRSKVSER